MSSRSITAANKAALTAQQVMPLYLVEAQFDSGTVRYWNGYTDLTALGETWLGAGNLMSVSAVEETSEIRAAGMQLGFSGIPTAMLSVVLAEDYQGRPVNFYLGALDTATGAVVADPMLVFNGRIDTMPIVEDGKTATIVASVESRLIRLEQASRRRYTHEDQQVDFPGDLGLQHVAAIQDVQIVWGVASPSSG